MIIITEYMLNAVNMQYLCILVFYTHIAYNDNMVVHHGTDNAELNPIYNFASKKRNDYGIGFYTTEDIELARE
jgi:hypothetical protein